MPIPCAFSPTRLQKASGYACNSRSSTKMTATGDASSTPTFKLPSWRCSRFLRNCRSLVSHMDLKTNPSVLTGVAAADTMHSNHVCAQHEKITLKAFLLQLLLAGITVETHCPMPRNHSYICFRLSYNCARVEHRASQMETERRPKETKSCKTHPSILHYVLPALCKLLH